VSVVQFRPWAPFSDGKSISYTTLALIKTDVFRAGFHMGVARRAVGYDEVERIES
jgi:hypothetical protein